MKDLLDLFIWLNEKRVKNYSQQKFSNMNLKISNSSNNFFQVVFGKIYAKWSFIISCIQNFPVILIVWALNYPIFEMWTITWSYWVVIWPNLSIFKIEHNPQISWSIWRQADIVCKISNIFRIKFFKNRRCCNFTDTFPPNFLDKWSKIPLKIL